MAALQVRDVEHAAARIEGEAAEAWPAIVDAVGLNGREQRHCTGAPVDLPDRARAAALVDAELSLIQTVSACPRPNASRARRGGASGNAQPDV